MLTFTKAAACNLDGLAQIGPTWWQMRGIRFANDTDGAAPANTPPEGGDEQTDDEPADTDTSDDSAEDDGDKPFDSAASLAKIRKLNSENKNLRKRATDAEAKAKDAEGDKERITGLESENARLKVALKHGLPLELASRLQGSTEEELLQDAEHLLEVFEGKKPPADQPKPRLRSGGDPTRPEDPTTDVDKFAERIFTH